MKLVYPEIDHVFDVECDKIQTLVIENPPLLYRLLNDLACQMNGGEGRCVLSEQGSVLPIAKHLELLTEFVPFSLNQRALLVKASAALERRITESDLYEEAMTLLHGVEAFLLKASFDLGGDLAFPKISVSALVKAGGPEFREEYASLAEKLLDYMELVTEFDRKKLYVLYNLRSVISDEEAELFLDTLLRRAYNVLMIESCEHPRLSLEQRYIVDADLCEIC